MVTCTCSCHTTLAIVTADGDVIHQAPIEAPVIEDFLLHVKPLTLVEAVAFAQCVLDAATAEDKTTRAGTMRLALVVVRMHRAMDELALSLEHCAHPLQREAGAALRNRMRGV
jgi:hypothetical protein